MTGNTPHVTARLCCGERGSTKAVSDLSCDVLMPLFVMLYCYAVVNVEANRLSQRFDVLMALFGILHGYAVVNVGAKRYSPT